MTKKNIFTYKLFFSLNISDFNYVAIALPPSSPPEKSRPPLFQQPPLKVEVLSSPSPFFKNLVGCSTPPAERGEYTLFDFD